LDYSVNMLIQWKKERADTQEVSTLIERVLWINDGATHLVTIDIDPTHTGAWPHTREITELQRSLEEGQAQIVRHDPFFRIYRLEEDIEEKHRKRRDQAWELIQDIVEHHGMDLLDSKVLGPLIRQAADRTGKDKKIFYRCLRRYWQAGQTKNALLPLWHKCGGKGQERIINDDEGAENHAKRGRRSGSTSRQGEAFGINMTTSMLEKIRRSKRLFYEQKGMSFADTYHQFCKTYFSVGSEMHNGILTPVLKPVEEMPQMNQFRYWFLKDDDLERALSARLGRRRFQEEMRPLIGTVRGAVHGPGSMFYYDATIADIYLRSSFDRTIIIGRPVVHVMIDLFSGLIAGFAVLMEGPSWLGAMLTLENMVHNKREYCAEHGFSDIEVEDWPSHHFPRAITGDRGELFSPRAQEICRVLKMQVSTTPPYRPTWKAAVERLFRTLNDEVIQFLPGFVHQRMRGEPDYRYAAQLTVEEFRKILISGIVRYNRSHEISTKHFTPDMIAARVEPYPSAIWRWGLENRMGDLNTLPIDDVRKCLLEKDTATVHRDGLHFHRLRYVSPTASSDHWYLKAQMNRSTVKKTVYFDRRTRNHIYVLLDDGGNIERCTLHPDDAKFLNLDWYEVEDQYAREKDARLARESYVRQQRVNDEAYRDQIVATARETTQTEIEQTKPSKAEQLQNSRDGKQQVAADERRRGVWALGKTESPSPHASATSTVDERTRRRLKLLEENDG
jgi:putative transposase